MKRSRKSGARINLRSAILFLRNQARDRQKPPKIKP